MSSFTWGQPKTSAFGAKTNAFGSAKGFGVYKKPNQESNSTSQKKDNSSQLADFNSKDYDPNCEILITSVAKLEGSEEGFVRIIKSNETKRTRVVMRNLSCEKVLLNHFTNPGLELSVNGNVIEYETVDYATSNPNELKVKLVFPDDQKENVSKFAESFKKGQEENRALILSGNNAETQTQQKEETKQEEQKEEAKPEEKKEEDNQTPSQEAEKAPESKEETTKKPAFGAKSFGFGAKQSPFAGKATFGAKQEGESAGFGAKTSPFAAKANAFGAKPAGFGAKSSAGFGAKPAGFGAKASPFGAKTANDNN